MLKRIAAAAALLAFSMLPALADDIKVGNLKIETPWARATPKGADVGAAYLTIQNDGAEADTLVSAVTDVANVQVHEMSMTGGVMKMREMKDGLPIAPHATLKRGLTAGQTITLTLKFAKAGEVSVAFPVEPVGSAGPKGGAGMSGMKM